MTRIPRASDSGDVLPGATAWPEPVPMVDLLPGAGALVVGGGMDVVESGAGWVVVVVVVVVSACVVSACVASVVAASVSSSGVVV
jgi:hypothetical protein